MAVLHEHTRIIVGVSNANVSVTANAHNGVAVRFADESTQ